MVAEPGRPFVKFYRVCLAVHSQPLCRALHYLGSGPLIADLATVIALRRPLSRRAGGSQTE